MEGYQSEEEQVEAIKKWWRENGRSIIVGAIIGIGAVFGWRGWQDYQMQTNAQASVIFAQLVQNLAGGQAESATQQGKVLRDDFSSTAYAVFAALAEARNQVEQGKIDAAKSQLNWVLEQGTTAGFQQIARLRLARLLLAEGDLDGATALLDQGIPGAFAGDYAALRGDIALAQQDTETAIRAYQLALAENTGNPALVQMQLDNLGVTGEVAAP